jgi:hypothetical protein
VLNKSTVKGSSSVIHVLWTDYGKRETARFINMAFRMANAYLKTVGFSVGLQDMCPTPALERATRALVQDMLAQPFTDEHSFNKMLNESSTRVGKHVQEALYGIQGEHNALYKMIKSGSKGNMINMVHICAGIGQQNVFGQRMPFGLQNRALVNTRYNDHSAAARGYVAGNFLHGMGPREMFFAAMAGREGLIDTACKTAQTGYLQRRLVKAMEDLCVQYDGTTRDADMNIVQFAYGEDAMDATYLETQPTPMLHAWNEDTYEAYVTWRRVPSCSATQTHLREERMQLDADRAEYLYYGNKERLHTCLTGYGRRALPFHFERMMHKLQHEREGTCKVTVAQVVVDVEALCAFVRVPLYQWVLRVWCCTARIVERLQLTVQEWARVVAYVRHAYTRARIDGGEMVGVIASHSVGESSTQMTLNSVDWQEVVLVRHQSYEAVVCPIGAFIDEVIDRTPAAKVAHLENETEYVDLRDEDYDVTCVDEHGTMHWKTLEAVTRHLPGGKLVHVRTRSGRSVRATKSKSFLVYEHGKIVPRRGSELNVGDRVPVVLQAPKNTEEVQEWYPSDTKVVGLGDAFARDLARYILLPLFPGSDFTYNIPPYLTQLQKERIPPFALIADEPFVRALITQLEHLLWSKPTYTPPLELACGLAELYARIGLVYDLARNEVNHAVEQS